jgi:exopolysaccharide production protein ExoZ
MMLNNIQVLRGFAALNVVYFHVIIISKSYNQPVEFFAFLAGWGANGVDVFFVISGFVMVYSQSVREKTPLSFIVNRTLRIVPIYWFLTICLLLLYLLFPSNFRQLKLSMADTIFSFLFLSGASGNEFPVLYVGWTLEYEMLFYILFCAGIFIKRKHASIFFPASILGLLTTMGLIELMALEFVFGMLCAKIYLSSVLKRLALPALFLAISWFITTIFFEFDIDRLFLYGVPSLFLVFALVHINQCKNTLLSFIGDASYSIYLVQVFTIPIFYKKTSDVIPAFNADVLSILALIFSGGIGCLVYILIEKPMIHYLKGKTIFRA